MTESAQHPPEAPLEQLRKTIAELLLLGVSGFAGIAVLFSLTLLGLLPSVEAAPWSAIIAGPIVIGTAGLTYLGIERLVARTDGPVRPIELALGHERAGLASGLGIAVVAMLAATGGSIVLSLLQNLVLSSEIQEQELITQLIERRDPFELALLSVSAVILAPISEELLFRHMLFRRLRQHAGPLAAWTLPGLVFGLVHGNPIGLLVYVWLATVFAWAYARSGRLWVAMLVHALHNGFTLTILLFAPEAIP